MPKLTWFKFHWFLGVVFGLPLIVVGVTGAMLSYEKEIMQLLNSKSYTVTHTPDAKMMDLGAIVESFSDRYPNEKIRSVSFKNSTDSSVIINIAQDGMKHGKDIFVDPYTAELLPELKGKDFFFFVFRLHRWLALDSSSYMSVGKQIVALSTISAIFLSISGLFILLRSIKRDRFKVLSINTNAKGRAFIASMHDTLGLWMMIPLLLMSLTGLYWSYDWYRAGFFKLLQTEQIQTGRQGQQKSGRATFAELQDARNVFESKMGSEFDSATIFLSKTGGAVEVRYLLASRTHDREFNTMFIARSDVVSNEQFRDKPLNEQIARSILPLHSGEYFGVIGRFVYFIGSFAMGFFAVTGFWLYFKRKRII